MVFVALCRVGSQCVDEEKAISVLRSTRVNRYESKNFVLSGDQLLIDQSIEMEEFGTNFVAPTGNHHRLIERTSKIRRRNSSLQQFNKKNTNVKYSRRIEQRNPFQSRDGHLNRRLVGVVPIEYGVGFLSRSGPNGTTSTQCVSEEQRNPFQSRDGHLNCSLVGRDPIEHGVKFLSRSELDYIPIVKRRLHDHGRKLLSIKRTRQDSMESYPSVEMTLEACSKFYCYKE
ncbi:hypothetical protein T11_2255 [Trichinella zimbabwensis]|uniref:Uncharacterized protein n=1 Tax=Trichinella zimbabwensis TaxID=268475 RepID=A0A0V1H832_9BILA|nr:hypothetical protein T11_2255 [Trichinella zimbabwensis]